jgi:exodeoxyribonuclease VII large subunit
VVQGDQAAPQVIAAIEGFNALTVGGDIPRPDVLIVARGGGSVEDLWAFNDEALARAVTASKIPLISAVGHETDTTLIDYVSDRRAPTPTAAAEIASPVLAELRAGILDLDKRLTRAGGRLLDDRRVNLAATARGLPRPADLLALASQRFDGAAGRLNSGLERNTNTHDRAFMAIAGRLAPTLLERPGQVKAERLNDLSRRLDLAIGRTADQAMRRARLPELALRLGNAVERRLTLAGERLVGLEKLRVSLDPDRPLARGFARIRKGDGSLARQASDLANGETIHLVFAGQQERSAVVNDGASPPSPAKPPARKPAPTDQGSLF